MNFEEVNEEQAEKNDYLVGCPLRPTEEKWSHISALDASAGLRAIRRFSRNVDGHG